MGDKAVELRVTGRVQGVSFRMAAEREARRLGVTGWVRNEPDGSVAALVEGDDELVDEMIAWCRQAPAYARVDAVDVTSAPVSGATTFRVRY